MIKSKHKYLDGQITELYVSGKTMQDVANILRLAHSTVAYRIKCLGLFRSISEALAGKPKSEAHKKTLSETRISLGLAKGSKNPKWKGGIELFHGVKHNSDELLEHLTVNDEVNQQPSVQSTKVQRLLENSDVLNNQLECPTRK